MPDTERDHEPGEAARPELGRRDAPDALRPDEDRGPDRKLPPEEPDENPQAPTDPRPTR